MGSLSDKEGMVCSSNPINDGLDSFRATFLSKVGDSDSFKQIVSSLPTDEGMNAEGIRWTFAY
jgi:hypothetical protein